MVCLPAWLSVGWHSCAWAPARGRILASLAGGLLLGIAVFLSYGLVLFGLVVLFAMLLTVRQRGLRSVLVPWLIATGGFVAVAAVHWRWASTG